MCVEEAELIPGNTKRKTGAVTQFLISQRGAEQVLLTAVGRPVAGISLPPERGISSFRRFPAVASLTMLGPDGINWFITCEKRRRNSDALGSRNPARGGPSGP